LARACTTLFVNLLMNRAIKIKGLIALAGATGLLLLPASFMARPTGGMIPGIIVAVGLQSMAAFWALMWALPKSNSAFFSIFVGDALLRLTGLGLATGWLWARQLPFTAPLLTLAFAYLVLSFVQIPFFCKVR
jgi:hypothetical protein